jgi:hypothetical protein
MREEADSPWVALWARFAQKNRVGFLDLYQSFIDPRLLDPRQRGAGLRPFFGVVSRYYFFPDVHWNAEGHAFVADRIVVE